jgi:hypothetical protein
MSLLFGAFRASRCTADGQKKNGAPEQQYPHHSYEVSLANHGTLTFVACIPCY